MYTKDTKDYKLYQPYMKTRKAFHFTGTNEAKADLVQYYAEPGEKKKKRNKRERNGMNRSFGILNKASL